MLPVANRYSTPGTHTSAAPPKGSSASTAASTPNTMGPEKPRDGEADGHQRALRQRGEAAAIHHGAQHLAQAREQRVALAARQRQQRGQRARTTARHRAA